MPIIVRHDAPVGYGLDLANQVGNAKQRQIDMENAFRRQQLAAQEARYRDEKATSDAREAHQLAQEQVANKGLELRAQGLNQTGTYRDEMMGLRDKRLGQQGDIASTNEAGRNSRFAEGQGNKFKLQAQAALDRGDYQEAQRLINMAKQDDEHQFKIEQQERGYNNNVGLIGIRNDNSKELQASLFEHQNRLNALRSGEKMTDVEYAMRRRDLDTKARTLGYRMRDLESRYQSSYDDAEKARAKAEYEAIRRQQDDVINTLGGLDSEYHNARSQVPLTNDPSISQAPPQMPMGQAGPVESLPPPDQTQQADFEAPQTPQAPQYQVGQIIVNRAGRRGRVAGIGDNGEPLIDPLE